MLDINLCGFRITLLPQGCVKPWVVSKMGLGAIRHSGCVSRQLFAQMPWCPGARPVQVCTRSSAPRVHATVGALPVLNPPPGEIDCAHPPPLGVCWEVGAQAHSVWEGAPPRHLFLNPGPQCFCALGKESQGAGGRTEPAPCLRGGKGWEDRKCTLTLQKVTCLRYLDSNNCLAFDTQTSTLPETFARQL